MMGTISRYCHVWVAMSMLALVCVAILVAGCSSEPAGPDVASENENTIETQQASSEIVEELQRELAGLGYYEGDIDGVYGAETTKAVKDFQTELGITVDGLYGLETYRALLTESGAEYSKATERLQQVLADLGYYDGEIDGKYEAATEAAVKSFQEAEGLVVDGTIGPQTIAAFEAPQGK